MALNVDDFKAKLVGGGARANLFKVICNFPGVAGGNTELASFMIKGTNLPASTVAPIEVSFRGTFPTEISAIELNYETNDAIEEFTVAINYQYWESNTTT